MLKRSVIIISAAIITLLISVYLSYDYWLERELKYALSEIISKDPTSLYKYNFKKLNINLVDGSVEVKGIKIEPRPRAYDSLIADSSAVRSVMKLQLEKIELIQFEIKEFIRTGKIIVQEIRLEQPAFSYYFNPTKAKRKFKTPLAQVFSEDFRSANIKKLYINDGQLEIDNYLTKDSALKINFLDIELIDAFMDYETLQNTSPIKYEEIKLVASSISAEISENYSIVSDSLHFDVVDESFIIRDFEIRPKYNQEAWSNLHNVQKQWFALKLKSLSFRQINIEHFINTGEIKVGRIRVREPNIALYKDKSKPEPPFKKKLLPASAINSIPIKLNVDSLQIIDGYLAIQETSKITGNNSHLSFYFLNGILTNFSNLPPDERKSNLMELRASALVFRAAPVELTMKFDLDSPTDHFTATGFVDSVDMVVFNPVLGPAMGAKVLDGRLHRLLFNFNGMDTLSTGVLDMDYNNAKVEILSTDSANEKEKKGFLSFAANTIIKSNNLKAKPGYAQGVINAKRVLNKDIWPFLWHSVQSGIVSTMAPITNNKDTRQQQKEVRQQLKQERKEGKD